MVLMFEGFLFHITTVFLFTNKVMILKLSKHPSLCSVLNSEVDCLNLTGVLASVAQLVGRCPVH